ncbi:hypothetical protein Celaphus_00015184 [Cervus elaphus hippelaphus]|uniref:Uncharacterized protein n=1 Tax=Cervus elaphus hippelaphus TaxID=46360 RepID=A0A212CSY7_CEREH|nr:hypothetical protein Celaphus_00015184 [Cervus elaphus hippelaphus]
MGAEEKAEALKLICIKFHSDKQLGIHWCSDPGRWCQLPEGQKWPLPEAAAARSWSRSLRLLNLLLGRCVLHLLGAHVDGGARHSGHDPAEKESSGRSRPKRVLTGLQESK